MSGTVTLLFADMEGSTRLLQQLGEECYAQVLDCHRELLRRTFEQRGGEAVSTEGDGFFAVFSGALDAVMAAIDAQHSLAEYSWPHGATVRLRMGLHTGEPIRAGENFVGLDVHRTARLCAAGHGRQVLLSEVTSALVERELPPGVGLRDLGEYQLKDLPGPEHIMQLLAPSLPPDLPPLRALGVHVHSLPLQVTPLLGRGREVVAARHLLLRETVKLVTLTGPAGTGKTRLAIEIAADVLNHFSDGVYFVGLAPIGEPELVVSAIVRTLGLQESGGTPLDEMLKSHLRDRQLLLVLDNFEHVLAAATLIAELLASCSGLKILVTSRAVLELYGEHEFLVPPLELPHRVETLSVEQLVEYPAVQLFTERAVAVKHDFAVTANNITTVAEICRRLDGLPLAIELAAARVRLLPPQAILSRLEHRLPLLTGGARDLPVRHQTLRGAIGWSYDLLDAPGRALFRRLAIFVGGWPLEAAGGDTDALDGLASLASKSLVQQKADTAYGAARFSMLETIREYGLEQLEASGELGHTRRWHAEFCAALAEEGEQMVGGPDQTAWLARLDEEHPNFRAALSWSLLSDDGDAGIGLRLASALWVFWFRRGYLREGSRWLQEARAANLGAPAAARAKLLTADGSIARLAGEFPRAEKLLHEGAALYRDLGDSEGVAWALSHLGLVKQWLGFVDLGVDMLEESLARRQLLGNQRDIARSLFNLALSEDFRSSYERAARRYSEALEAQRLVGDTWGKGRVFAYLGQVALRQGDTDRAARLCEEGLPLSRAVADGWGIALAIEGLGRIAATRGDYARAIALLNESLAMFRDVGSRDRVAECLQDLASVAIAQRQIERATRLSAAAEATQQTTGMAFWPAVQARRDQELATARARLGEAAFQRLWSEGLGLTLEQAIDYARAVLDPEVAASDAAVAVSSAHPLTRREVEVALLLARGLTNRQIADALVIGERTADTHVAHILAKLGFTSRARIAAWVVEQGLVAEAAT